MKMGAEISSCGRYRYSLVRAWGASDSRVAWVMLNPSTANATEDDPTIRRCVRFARDWGFDGIHVVNLYALRATNPKRLWGDEDPVGPDNDAHLRHAFSTYGLVVFAWGNHARPERVAKVEAIAHDVGALEDARCLGKTLRGQPRHPLYLKRTTELQSWLA